ncbi:hypothetical protein DPMN_102037 [Dreissena polymorpha]|uniref:Uncharacterized protein n=1 Tax=Dreissena polymorpha TaxID=45954 RepID=A0A9D4R8T7_DREPO|nr:hypothetical protein DPMN_102037 [Dreissena polymorpha]
MKSAKALPRYGSGHKSARQTYGKTDGRTTPKQYPSAYGGVEDNKAYEQIFYDLQAFSI